MQDKEKPGSFTRRIRKRKRTAKDYGEACKPRTVTCLSNVAAPRRWPRMTAGAAVSTAPSQAALAPVCAPALLFSRTLLTSSSPSSSCFSCFSFSSSPSSSPSFLLLRLLLLLLLLPLLFLPPLRPLFFFFLLLLLFFSLSFFFLLFLFFPPEMQAIGIRLGLPRVGSPAPLCPAGKEGVVINDLVINDTKSDQERMTT